MKNVRPDLGVVFAEQFARFMGTAKFLMYMTLFVIVWMAWFSGVRAECTYRVMRIS